MWTVCFIFFLSFLFWTNLNSLLSVCLCVVHSNSQPKSSLSWRIQHLDEWSTTSSSTSCPFFVCRQPLLLLLVAFPSLPWQQHPTAAWKQHQQTNKKKKKKKSFFFFFFFFCTFFSCRERETAASERPDGWMDGRRKEEIKQKEYISIEVEKKNPDRSC